LTRRLRTAVTMVVLIVILVAAAYFGWLGLTQGWLGGSETTAAEKVPTRSCTTPPPVTVQTRSVRVSVYNAGAPSGQATEVMEALADQGFVQGELTDAPERIEVEGIVLWPGDADPDAVQLVRRQFDRVRVAEKPEPLGPGVNVLVGDDFDGLAPQAPRSIDIAQARRCRSAGHAAGASRGGR
jgi:hypothetical protein